MGVAVSGWTVDSNGLAIPQNAKEWRALLDAAGLRDLPTPHGVGKLTITVDAYYHSKALLLAMRENQPKLLPQAATTADVHAWLVANGWTPRWGPRVDHRRAQRAARKLRRARKRRRGW